MIIDSEAIKKRAKEQRLLASREKQKAMVKAHKARNAETFQSDSGRDRLDEAAQFGRPLRASDIQKRLRAIIPGIRFEVSNAVPSRTGIYKGEQFILKGAESERWWEATAR